jgi:DNA modification methylase
MFKSISELTPDNKNARRATQRSRDAVKDSLERLGAGRSILLDKNGRVIAGNTTLGAAKDLGLKNVITVETTGDSLVAVVRTDIDLDSPEGRELAIADNRTAQFAEWNPEVLTELSSRVDLLPFFNEAELEELGVELSSGIGDANAKSEEPEEPAPLDQADELRKKWNTAVGQIWEIPSQKTNGTHRLMCGDSTNAEQVALLLRDANPKLMVSDPPYGVGYDPDWRLEAGINKPWQTLASGKVSNDDRADWTEAWKHFPGDVVYVWHGGLHSRVVAESLEQSGFTIRCQVIWAKPTLVMGRGAYHWQHEPCFYAVRDGKTAEWAGDRKQTSLWQIANMHRTQGDVDDGKTFHSTQKPVECMARPMRNHFSEGCEVYDPFLGSGTTVVAAEQTGRIALAMELEPKYIAVAIERLANMGLEPRWCNAR